MANQIERTESDIIYQEEQLTVVIEREPVFNESRFDETEILPATEAELSLPDIFSVPMPSEVEAVEIQEFVLTLISETNTSPLPQENKSGLVKYATDLELGLQGSAR